jgi:hypothetical protein
MEVDSMKKRKKKGEEERLLIKPYDPCEILLRNHKYIDQKFT